MRPKNQEIVTAILDALSFSEPRNPTQMLQETFKLSRQQVARYFSDLCRDGLIRKSGNGRGVKYLRLGNAPSKAFVVHKMPTQELADLGEDQVYERYVEGRISTFSNNVRSILHHAFVEMVNNVIDHSRSSHSGFELKQEGNSLLLEVWDDGVGIFARNREFFQCESLFEAIAETAKGRRTSDAKRHAGEGIFFTSRLCDQFSIDANGLRYAYFSRQDDWTIEELTDPEKKRGTRVVMSIALTTTRTPSEVFAEYTDENMQFNKGGRFVVQPYVLTLGKEPVSRSEARRLLAGAEVFQQIILDFKNAQFIGQGFADEVFRVFQEQHPKLVIDPINMNDAVRFMVNRARARVVHP